MTTLARPIPCAMSRVDVGPKSPELTTRVPLRVRPRERLKLAEGGGDVTFDPDWEPASSQERVRPAEMPGAPR